MHLPSSRITPGSIRSAIRGYTTRPPTYFAQHLQSYNDSKDFAPSPQNIFSSPSAAEQSGTNYHHQRSQEQNQGQQQQQHSDSNDPVGGSRLSTIRDLSVVVSILSLTYFALDNYRVRTTLEQRSMEQSVAHMKSMAIAQNKVNMQRKNRELQVLNERKQTQKREMKMVYHIAMLRKQLMDAGLKPSEFALSIFRYMCTMNRVRY